MICPACRAEVSGTPRFCPECGARTGTTPAPGRPNQPAAAAERGLGEVPSHVRAAAAAGGGRYLVERELGQGGMGEVVLAFDTSVRRRVAVKRMRPETAEDRALVERFQHEAQTLGQLANPHIVQIFDAGGDEAGPYIVMEYLEGKDLAEEVRRDGPMALEDVLEVGRHVLKALREAHGQRIFHRDIKPANLRRDRAGTVKLIDWGLARTGSRRRTGLSEVGDRAGTDDYMAPEQLDGEEIDGRADLYALGKTLYECLTGQKPRTVRLDDARIPVPLRRILMRALEEDRERRPPSAADMLLEWERAALSLGGRGAAPPAGTSGGRGWAPGGAAVEPGLAPDQVACPGCAAVNPRTRPYCKHCGQRLHGKCARCGQPHEADERHCGRCGANLEEAARARVGALLGEIEAGINEGAWAKVGEAIGQLREVDPGGSLPAGAGARAVAKVQEQVGAEEWAAAEAGLGVLEALGVAEAEREQVARAVAGARKQAQERAQREAERERARRADEERERQAAEAAKTVERELLRQSGPDVAEMVAVPAGEFLMGSDAAADEKPPHKVYLDAFAIDKHPVTNARWKAFMDAGGYRERKYWSAEGWQWRDQGKVVQPERWKDSNFNAPEQPVVGVSWYEAEAFCRWAGKRLPTEAEWEKAARGTDGRTYPWGNDWDKSRANSDESGIRKTTPVGTYPKGASPYGAQDMAGNVYEWVGDWYDGNYYKQSPARNPKGPDSGSLHVLRGGSWHDGPISLRATYRSDDTPDYRLSLIGFRCARGSSS